MEKKQVSSLAKRLEKWTMNVEESATPAAAAARSDWTLVMKERKEWRRKKGEGHESEQTKNKKSYFFK